MLRNLRAICTCGSPAAVELASRKIVDRRAIRASRVFPFGLMTALRRLEGSVVLLTIRSAPVQALDLACCNVPRFDGCTEMAVDGSGSMTRQNRRSNSCGHLAALLAAAAVKRSLCDVLLFDVMPLPEKDRGAVVRAIEAVEL